MFVQVIEGNISDAGQMRAALERWAREVAPGAISWLEFTGGVTAGDRFIGLARFDSAEAAQPNSARPEQDRWWTRTAKLFTGQVTFPDSSDVVRDVAGDTDQAGFVQVMRGRSSDPQRARELMAQNAGAWAASRPEVIGSAAVTEPWLRSR